jgi:hypothetical protein
MWNSIDQLIKGDKDCIIKFGQDEKYATILEVYKIYDIDAILKIWAIISWKK